MTKIISRKKSRKFLFQKLFSDTYHNNDTDLFNNAFIIDSYKWHLDEKYLEEMEGLIKQKQPELIEILKMYAPKFSPEKMDLTYVLPIFIACAEMLWFSDEIPGKVSLNEAIEISKIFGSDTAKKIVNWVLNNVYINFEEIKKKINNIEKKSDFNFFIE